MIEIIAEMGSTHGGSLENALTLISHAATAGATGVKFQAFSPLQLAGRRVNHPRLKRQYTHADLVQLYAQIHTPREWFPQMIATAKSAGLTWHASVFDPADVAFLETLGCPRYKIASFESGDDDIRKAVARTGKPVILSANQDENVYPLNKNTLILHATNYGVEAKDTNLRRLRYWARDRAKFDGLHFPWGLSDHTTSSLAAQIAATLGAQMIEKHIRLSGVNTPDDTFAVSPEVFDLMVRRVRAIQEAIT